MNTSQEIKDLAAALAKAQAEIDSAKKSTRNDYFGSKYADLAEVWYAIREAVTKNGISIIQTPTATFGEHVKRTIKIDKGKNNTPDYREITEREATIHVTTRLVHESGQWIEETLSLMPNKNDPQALGSAITYARRYALAAIVGVAQDDDDGNAASGNDTAANRSAAAAEKKAAQNQAKGESDKEGSKQPAGNKPAGDEEKKARMKFSEIKKLIKPELRDLFQKRNTVTSMIEDYWDAFGGDQAKIIEAIKKADEEAAANAK